MNEIVVPSSLRERLEALGGRRHQAWAIAGLIAAVVLGALLLWSGGGTARIAPPATALSRAPAAQQAGQAATPGPVSAVLVHVAGAVRRPGLYELDAGARVADALSAAGGPLRRADLDALNLAESLVDGAKIEVAVRGRAVAGTVVPAPGATASPGVAVIDLNTADAQLLETIPGVGPVTAAAILEYRAQIGSFTSVDQLLEVTGIGPVTLENMRPYVTI